MEAKTYLYALQTTCNDQCPQVRRHGVKTLEVTSKLLELGTRSPVFGEIFNVRYLFLNISFRSTLVDLGQDDAGTIFLAFSDHFDRGTRVSYNTGFGIGGQGLQ